MPTPHIECGAADIAKTVILTSDPVFADRIAKTRLEGARKINGVRNMLGFTGLLGEKQVTVMGTGMGIPSVSVYVHELFTVYGVKNALRINTCFAISDSVKPGDIVLPSGASTTSNINRLVFPGTFCPAADFGLLRAVSLVMEKLGKGTVHTGNILTCDALNLSAPPAPSWKSYGVLAADLDTAGFYTSTQRNGARAAALSVVEGSFADGAYATAEERNAALELAAEAAALVAGAFAE